MESQKIRPVGYIKLTRTSRTYINELIRRETSTEAGDQIPFVINAKSVLLYDPSLSAEDLIKSLEVMKKDILLRKEVE